MTDLSVKLVLSLAGSNLVKGLDTAGRGVTRFGAVSTRVMAGVSRATEMAANGIDRLGNRYTAFVTGAAAAGAGRFLVSQERRMTRLGITADLTGQQLQELRDEIYDAAQAIDTRVDPSEILSAIENIVEKTGDLKFARDNIRNIALALQATGAEGSSIGELVGELQKMGVTGTAEVLQAIDTLNVQGKTGAFTLSNLAALGPRVITAYSAAVKGQRDGATVLREMGAALQVIRGGVGSAEMAATAFERLLSELQDAQKQRLFKRLGVDIFELGADGEKVLRPINELMLEILDKTKGDRTKLGGIFGDESIRAFNALTPERMASYMAAVGKGEQTMADSARAARDAEGALTNVYTAFKRFTNVTFSPDLQRFADTLNSVDPEAAQRWLKIAAAVGTAVGALVIARKLFNAGKSIAGGIGDIVGAGKTKGDGGGVAGAAGVARVWVVNMPGGGFPGGPDFPAGDTPGGKPGKKPSRAARLGNIAGKGLALTGAGAVGWEIGSMISDAISGSSIENAIGRAVALALSPVSKDARDALRTELTGKMVVSVEDNRTRVKSFTTNQPGVDLDAHSGMIGATP